MAVTVVRVSHGMVVVRVAREVVWNSCTRWICWLSPTIGVTLAYASIGMLKVDLRSEVKAENSLLNLYQWN